MKLLFCLLLTIAAVRASERPPNIVFILADDLGITDIGAYARHFTDAKADELYYETPNLDKLSADGISFSQSYANQLCSPTRAAILTGRIASRMGVTTATPHTKTYHNQELTLPDGYDPHDVLEHKDPIKGKRPWINATTNTALDPSVPTWRACSPRTTVLFSGNGTSAESARQSGNRPLLGSRKSPISMRADRHTSNGRGNGIRKSRSILR